MGYWNKVPDDVLEYGSVARAIGVKFKLSNLIYPRNICNV